jgi:hypothetical protein
MALTFRTAGAVVTTSYFNDYYNLLTGVMVDQNVTVENNISAKALSATLPTAPTLVAATGTNLGTGIYTYAVGYNSADGTSIPGTTATITLSSSRTVSISNIPTGPTGTVSRTVYRSTVGSSALRVLTTISGNTVTTYTDTTTDTTLLTQASAPLQNSFGGAVRALNNSGTVGVQMTGDGILAASTVLFGVGSISKINTFTWSASASATFYTFSHGLGQTPKFVIANAPSSGWNTGIGTLTSSTVQISCNTGSTSGNAVAYA